jgi:hypothetical protein
MKQGVLMWISSKDCFKRSKSALLQTIVLACFVSLPSSLAYSQIKMEVGMISDRSYLCTSDYSVYYVGGHYAFRVTISPEGKRPGEVEYTGISDWAWPEGLIIEADQPSTCSEPFLSSQSLADRLGIEYYVDEIRAMRDSLWRTGVTARLSGITAPEYFFAFRVPPELTDSYLRFYIVWNHPKYGHLIADHLICLKIVTPCSETAQHEVWTSQVRLARSQMKYNQVVALADSFINSGWHDRLGLIDARGAAKRLGRYNDAIRFLDICFEYNHQIDIEPTPQLPEFDEINRRSYEQQRTRLLELKEQQDQQQQNEH